jgi:hypothetical protein
MELICFDIVPDRVDLHPAPRRRGWMDDTPNAFAYRCLPLTIANSHGWEMLCPFGFEIVWNGGPLLTDLAITTDAPNDAAFITSHFGCGIVTFNPMVILRTPVGWNLWLTGPVNAFKDGVQAMSASMETDWMPYTFSVNWKVTRPGAQIRFEKGEPFCCFFPVKRGVVAACEPRRAPLSSTPAVENAYKWAHARRGLGVTLVSDTKEQFQGWYMRGDMPDRSPQPIDDHESGITPRPFS